MPKLGENSLSGQSGKTYRMNVYTSDIQFNDFIPGVYLMSSVDDAGEERYIFLGETDNIYPLLQKHPEQAKFDAENYNRISFHMNASRDVRTAIIGDLLPTLKPVCN